jgi:hypothetical protein
MDRRASPRTPITAACRLRSRAGGAIYAGRVESISRSAALVAITAAPAGCRIPAIGERVVVDVQLPRSHRFARKCLRCFGQVVRVMDDGAGLPQLALALTYMAFQDVVEPADSGARRRTACDA